MARYPKFYKTCKKLNELLYTRPEDYILKINLIFYKEVFYEGGGLYWGRELFIECNGYDNECRRMIRTRPDEMVFIPIYDDKEHPGVKFNFKRYETR